MKEIKEAIKTGFEKTLDYFMGLSSIEPHQLSCVEPMTEENIIHGKEFDKYELK